MGVENILRDGEGDLFVLLFFALSFSLDILLERFVDTLPFFVSDIKTAEI